MKLPRILPVLILILAPLVQAQTADQLIANRAPAGPYVGAPIEAPYWTAPEVRTRTAELVQAVFAGLSDPAYVPTPAERSLVEVWWRFDGVRDRSNALALELLRRVAPIDSFFAATHVRRFITTPADYEAAKAAGWVHQGVPLTHPSIIAAVATRFGDFAAVDALDRSQIMRWPYTSDDYKAWMRWKAAAVPTDAARYQLIQDEIDLVGMAPSDEQQQRILQILQAASDLYFARLRRAQLLNQP